MNIESTFNNICISDIWNYECEVIYQNKSDELLNELFLITLLDNLQEEITKNGKSVFGVEMAKSNPSYYKKQVELLRANQFKDIKGRFVFDFFMVKNDCYSYNREIIIQNTDKKFQYWFALKLRQYNERLSLLIIFLDNHLRVSFENNTASFLEFIEMIVLQYSEILTEKIKTTITWKTKKLFSESNVKISNDRNCDLKLWNAECFDLFEYLVEKYVTEKGKKQKFSNIYIYLKSLLTINCATNKSPKRKSAVLRANKDEYRKYVSANFDIDYINSKINISSNHDDQIVILNDLHEEFLDNYLLR